MASQHLFLSFLFDMDRPLSLYSFYIYILWPVQSKERKKGVVKELNRAAVFLFPGASS
jgi:hypothetical protein